MSHNCVTTGHTICKTWTAGNSCRRWQRRDRNCYHIWHCSDTARQDTSQFTHIDHIDTHITWHRHHCFKSGNIPKTKGGQIYLNFVTVLWSPWNWTATKMGFVGAKESYRKHAFAYPQPQFLYMCWSWGNSPFYNFLEIKQINQI